MSASPNHRRSRIADALDRLIPRIPTFDRDEIIAHALGSPGLKRASPEAAAWASAVAYIRHVHTDYDALLGDGYGIEAARHFTREPINTVLGHWGARRRLAAATPDEPE